MDAWTHLTDGPSSGRTGEARLVGLDRGGLDLVARWLAVTAVQQRIERRPDALTHRVDPRRRCHGDAQRAGARVRFAELAAVPDGVLGLVAGTRKSLRQASAVPVAVGGVDRVAVG